MIISVKYALREARWFWFFVAATMLTGSGFRYFLKGRGGSTDAIAWVDGKAVTNADFVRQIRKDEFVNEYLRRYGINVGPVDQVRALQACMRDAVVGGLADDLGIVVDDQAVGEEIKKQLPSYIFKEDGSVDEATYASLVKQSGDNSINSFEEHQREALERKLMMEILKGSSFVATVDKEVDTSNDVRSFEVVRLKKSDVLAEDAESELSDAEVRNFYEEHKGKYKDQGSARLKIVYVDKNKIGSAVLATPQEISDYYNRYKMSRYTTKKNYTLDFWVFKGKEDDLEERAQAFSNKYQILGLADDFGICKEKAEEEGLQLDIYRNHKILLGEGKYSPALEKAIVEISAEGLFSNPVRTKSDVHVVRLVKKEGASVRSLEDASSEIAVAIKDRKKEYETGRVSNAIVRLAKEMKGGFDQLESKLEQFEEQFPGVISVEDLQVGPESDTRSFSSKLPDVDMLERGKVGRVSDSDRDIIYLVESVKKRTVKPLEDVEKEVESALRLSRAEKKMTQKANEIKKELVEGGVWIVEPESFESLSRSETDRYPGLGAVASVIFEKLNNTKGVYVYYGADEVILCKLSVDPVGVKSRNGEGFSDLYLEKILEEKLKSATIEERMSSEIERHRKRG